MVSSVIEFLTEKKKRGRILQRNGDFAKLQNSALFKSFSSKEF